MEMTAKLMANPARLMQAQIGFWQDYMTLWQNTARRMIGSAAAAPVPPVIQADPKDRRFKDEAWKENEIFDFIKQSYLLSARFVQDVVGQAEGMDRKTAQKVDFYSRQFIDAMSPSNFLLTNPEVLRKTAETGGENLLRGLNNLLGDLERGKGKLAIKMTDMDAFKLGENIGVSPGKVVFQNDLMQLIQYAPTTETVLKRPLLILPPWINKFYILDLRPKNSLVRWAVSQGHTVFMVSWVNPSEAMAEKGFEDYMKEGVFGALAAIEQATGEREVNAIGYCLGGTLLASTLPWMKAHGDDSPSSPPTFFVTMTDFAEAGELGVFIDEEQLAQLEAKMERQGVLQGSDMATTFNMLRANDLIWSFVVNNYLLGNEPFQFDLLYWNSDATRMPAKMHSYYLRNLYHSNKLATGELELAGERIDLGSVDIPTYFISTREDHIAPWRSTYRGTQLMGGPKRFVLAASGHIAGVVNPPDSGKYSHWLNEALPPNPDEWFAGAQEMAGSWWPDWHRWVSGLDSTTVPARVPGTGAPAGDRGRTAEAT